MPGFLPWGLLQHIHRCLAKTINLCSDPLTSLRPYSPQYSATEWPTYFTTRVLYNVGCQGVPPNAGNISIICAIPPKLWDKKKTKIKNQTLKKALPLILWWQLLHSATLYRIRFTRPVSSHLKLKCPYQLVTGVPPGSSQLHRRDVREKLEKPLTQGPTPPQKRRYICESVDNFSPDIHEYVN